MALSAGVSLSLLAMLYLAVIDTSASLKMTKLCVPPSFALDTAFINSGEAS